MTISAPDLGGSGNGLGLPIANPLYGPGNAAVLANLAQNQNMAQAQATTAETQARTNRDIQTLQPDIAFKNAQTNLTSQQAAAAQIENDAKNVLGPQRIAQGMDADIMSKSTEAQQKSHDYLQRQIIQNADILDNKSPQEANQILEGWGQQAGLKPGEASSIYGGLAASKAVPLPAAGPGTAGNANLPPTGGYANLRRSLLEANPDIFKERLSQTGATERANIQATTEQKVAQLRADSEQAVARMDPEKASQYFTDRYNQLLASGDQAGAEAARSQAVDAMLKKGYFNESMAYARNAYNPLAPALSSIASQISGGKTAPGQPQPQVGQPPQGQPGAAPQPPPIGGQPSVPQPPPQPQGPGGNGMSTPPPNGGPPNPMPGPTTTPQEAELQFQSMRNNPQIPLQNKAAMAQAAGWKLMKDKAGNIALVSPNGKDHMEIPH